MTGEPFSLAGDTGANYTIIATDKAGSTTEYNVTMKPIENLIESIADLTTGNVTSDDQETVKSVKKNKGRGYRGRETGFARDHRQMR